MNINYYLSKYKYLYPQHIIMFLSQITVIPLSQSHDNNMYMSTYYIP